MDLRIWELETGRCLDVLRGHTDSVTSVAFTPDGQGIVSASADGTVRVWPLEPLGRAGSSPRRRGQPSRSTPWPSVPTAGACSAASDRASGGGRGRTRRGGRGCWTSPPGRCCGPRP
ncbi:hypothetical protein [Streptomyces sp. NPDC001340]